MRVKRPLRCRSCGESFCSVTAAFRHLRYQHRVEGQAAIERIAAALGLKPLVIADTLGPPWGRCPEPRSTLGAIPGAC